MHVDLKQIKTRKVKFEANRNFLLLLYCSLAFVSNYRHANFFGGDSQAGADGLGGGEDHISGGEVAEHDGFDAGAEAPVEGDEDAEGGVAFVLVGFFGVGVCGGLAEPGGEFGAAVGFGLGGAGFGDFNPVGLEEGFAAAGVVTWAGQAAEEVRVHGGECEGWEELP